MIHVADDMSLGTALGMLYDAMLDEFGLYGEVFRCPSPTGETWIGWRSEAISFEAPIKLPMKTDRVSAAIEEIRGKAFRSGLNSRR